MLRASEEEYVCEFSTSSVRQQDWAPVSGPVGDMPTPAEPWSSSAAAAEHLFNFFKIWVFEIATKSTRYSMGTPENPTKCKVDQSESSLEMRRSHRQISCLMVGLNLSGLSQTKILTWMNDSSKLFAFYLICIGFIKHFIPVSPSLFILPSAKHDPEHEFSQLNEIYSSPWAALPFLSYSVF